MTLHTYTVTVQHDNGITRMTVRASSAAAVIAIVQDIEKCPARAIRAIKRGSEEKEVAQL